MISMKKTPVVLGVLALVSVFFIGGLWFGQPEDPIGPKNFRRIQLGMTQQEIESIIGAPPIITRSSPLLFGTALEERGEPVSETRKQPWELAWWSGSYGITVRLDANLRAKHVRLWERWVIPKPPTVFDRLRNWFGF